MIITIIIFSILYLLDQISKYLSQMYLTVGAESKVLIPNILELNLTYNTGAAFSLGSNFTWLLVLISALATVLLGYFALKNDWKHEKVRSFFLTMALAGCVGNLFDRIISITPLSQARCGVVDMISLKPFDAITNFLGFGTSIFNVADAFLMVGLFVFVIDVIFFQDRRRKKLGLK